MERPPKNVRPPRQLPQAKVVHLRFAPNYFRLQSGDLRAVFSYSAAWLRTGTQGSKRPPEGQNTLAFTNVRSEPATASLVERGTAPSEVRNANGNPMGLAAQPGPKFQAAPQPIPSLECKTHILRFPQQNLHLAEPPPSSEPCRGPRLLFPTSLQPL